MENMMCSVNMVNYLI